MKKTKNPPDSVVLPLAESPIKTYLGFVANIGITLNNEKTWEWFHNHFVQISYRDGGELLFKTYYPNLKKGKNFYAQDVKNAVDFVRNLLFDNKYIIAEIDDFYIPCRLFYNREHLRHASLIYGYDDDKRVFYISGYDENWIYIKSTITYEELSKAFYSTHENSYFNIRSYKKSHQFKFNKKLMKDFFVDYLESNDSYYRTFHSYNPVINFAKLGLKLERKFLKSKVICGMAVYEPFIEYISALGSEGVFLKTFHTFYEHKKLMRMRIEFMQENGYIQNAENVYEQSKIIEQKSLIVRNILIKCRIKNSFDEVTISKIIKLVEEIRDMEIDLMRELVRLLS